VFDQFLSGAELAALPMMNLLNGLERGINLMSKFQSSSSAELGGGAKFFKSNTRNSIE
jgi:hypothetical protein